MPILLLAAACAPHMAPPPTQGANPGAQPDHHILLFEDSVLPADLDARVRQAGGALTGSLPEIGVVFASSSDPRFMERASLIDGVQGVSPDVGEGLTPWARNDGEAQPRESVDTGDDDELYRLQWGHQAMDVPRAWALGARGAGVRVAVIDNGIDATHPDLAGRINHHLSRSFAPAVAWDDPIDSHGTSVASVLVAEDNGRGMIGVAPEAELVVIRVQPGGPPTKALFSWMLESLAYAVEIDADVVNVSITVPLPTDGGCVGRQRPRADEARVCFTAEEVATLLESFNRISRHAWMNDTLIFTASGNYAMTVTEDDGTTLLPAEAEYVFSIAATGPHGRADDPDVSLDDVPAYSNVGDGFVAFAAPGGRFRIDPDAAEDCTSRPALPDSCLDNVVTAKAGGGYWLRGGTSYASPHAAGVAALIFSVLPHKSAPVVLGLMRLGAEDLGPPGRDARYGFGRLNAGNSVQRAIALSSAAR